MSEPGYLRPSANVSIEFKERRSVFLGHVRLSISEEQAREELRLICDQYKDATHNCWAYKIGFPSSREYFSDAGEPSGTAGKPISGAIHRQHVTDILVVVTRYYGGIKLGVRGLIEAYGRAATLAIESSGFDKYVPSRNLQVLIPYESQRNVFHLLRSLDINTEQASIFYSEMVDITVPVPLTRMDQLEDLFRTLKARRAISKWDWLE